MRHSTVKAWRDLLYQVVNEQDVEDKYFELLREADRMKKAGFINEDEWRNADSTRIWTPIPRTLGQRFHADLDTHSTATWTLIPRALGQ